MITADRQVKATDMHGSVMLRRSDNRGSMLRIVFAALVFITVMTSQQLRAQDFKRSDKQIVSGGVLLHSDSTANKSAQPLTKAEQKAARKAAKKGSAVKKSASKGLDTLNVSGKSVKEAVSVVGDSLNLRQLSDTTVVAPAELSVTDSVGAVLRGEKLREAQRDGDTITAAKERHRKVRLDENGNEIIRQPLFSDSSSLSKVCWTAALLPGYGQIYNKQYWKLPILYTTMGASIAMAVHEGNLYKPLKQQYEALTTESMSRTEELNQLQSRMIRTNTKRQLFWVAAAASYIYFLGDAAVNYSTNEVSDVKKATTLSLICPGAGQIYNKSYWKVPIVIGGMASMVYVIDWNNRGFQRFKKAYALRADFDTNPGNYPDGQSKDEFHGRYSASYLKNLRDAYRRNRDLSMILTVAVYAFQAIDAHVDAHLKDFDISDDLTVRLDPMFDYQYTQLNGTQPVFGFNLNVKF